MGGQAMGGSQTMVGQAMGGSQSMGGPSATTQMGLGRSFGATGPVGFAAPVFGRSIVHPRSVSTYGRYFASFTLGGQEISASLASSVMSASKGAAPSSGIEGGRSVQEASGVQLGNPEQSSSDKLILNLLSGGFEDNQQSTNRELQGANKVQASPPTDLSACDPAPNLKIDGSSFLVSHSKAGCNPMTWMEAVDFCQKNNMVITSLGSSVDQLTAKKIMDIPTKFTGMPGFWIGGYVAHPDDKRVANTVTWTAMSRDADLISPGQGIFSKTGESGEPQPDNWEFKNSTDKAPFKKEHCLAVLNNKFNDGLKVHDLACFRKLPVVCKELFLNPLGKLMDPLALPGFGS